MLAGQTEDKEYKEFTVDEKTGAVIKMKIRKI